MRHRSNYRLTATPNGNGTTLYIAPQLSARHITAAASLAQSWSPWLAALGRGHTILTSREVMWYYARSWDVKGGLTLNSMTRIHSSVTLLTSRGALVGSRASTPLKFLSSHTFREVWPTCRVLKSTWIVSVSVPENYKIAQYICRRRKRFSGSNMDALHITVPTHCYGAWYVSYIICISSSTLSSSYHAVGPRLARSGCTHPEVSSRICPGSFCLLVWSFFIILGNLSWGILLTCIQFLL